MISFLLLNIFGTRSNVIWCLCSLFCSYIIILELYLGLFVSPVLLVFVYSTPRGGRGGGGPILGFEYNEVVPAWSCPPLPACHQQHYFISLRRLNRNTLHSPPARHHCTTAAVSGAIWETHRETCLNIIMRYEAVKVGEWRLTFSTSGYSSSVQHRHCYPPFQTTRCNGYQEIC